jgi:hypothetical protein
VTGSMRVTPKGKSETTSSSRTSLPNANGNDLSATSAAAPPEPPTPMSPAPSPTSSSKPEKLSGEQYRKAHRMGIILAAMEIRRRRTMN